TNTSADDLNLTYIATLSNNYGGYFMSLHTNGGNASANYTIAFFRGATYSPYAQVIAPSQAMGLALAKEHHNHMLTNETYSTPRSQSDYAFWGWNYGVLRTNNRAGYLIEAWFHDYRPETLRLKSDHYNKFLAWQTARAFQVSPGGVGTLKGCIIGDVRDLTKGCGYSNYATRGRDSYLAINNATVNLYNSSGTKLQTVKTDAYCNGVFAFFGLTTGTYTVEVTGVTGYKTAKASVSVTTNEASVKQINLTAGVDSGISFNPTSTGYGETPVGNVSGKTIAVTGSGLSGSITVTNSDNTNFWVKETTLPATGGTLNVTYKPQSKGSHSTTITCKSGDKVATCVVTGTAYNAVPTFTEGWNFSEKNGKKADWMGGVYTNCRNMAFGNGKLYIVDAPNGKIKVVKVQTAELIKELDMTGVADGALKVLDVAFVDGKLVASNIATKNADTSIATLKVYVWDNDDAAPKCILKTTNIGGMDRVGDAVEIKGNLTNGQICYLGQQSRSYTTSSGTTTTGNCNSLVTYAITNGTVSTTPVVKDIDGFIIGGSPRLIPFGNDYIAVGQNYRPSVVTAAGELTQSLTSTALQACQGNDIAVFSYKGDTYAFATEYDPGTAGDANTMLYNGRAALINLSDGWADAERKADYPSTGFSSNVRNVTWSSSICVNVNGDKGIEMWVLVHNQGIAYYKHGTVPTYTYDNTDTPVTPEPEPEQPVNPGVTAPTLTKVWEYTSGIPTASATLSGTESAYGTGFNGTVYTVNKNDNTIYAWNKSQQKVAYANNANFTGVAITCDDAGNLLVNTGIYTSSATAWNIVAASNKAVTPITVTFPSDIASGNTYHVGRIVGNMLSSEGAYVYLTRAAINKVACVKIVNGAIAAVTSSDAINGVDAAKVQNISYAHPSMETVAQINASSKPANCFYFRDRLLKNYFTTGATSFAAPSGAYSTDGGDVVTLDGKTYAMFPMGTTYGSAFAIVETSSKEVVAEEKNTVANVSSYQSLVFEKVSETKANIYQFYAGGKVAMYTFEVPGVTTGIDSVNSEVEAPAEYYNLQGVKVTNPAKGLYIKKQGDKATKVIL
ncbi:MAG: SdrD B-like domain-containing protein, partial [Muribaculaceae bacterium]|nr:SdrD B-like domain-containing protein [Muribaculaceae bacterium]